MDLEEVDTRSFPNEEDMLLALSHGFRGLCVLEALFTRAPASRAAFAQCRKAAEELRALLFRSLCVNHPVTFFRGLCLSLGVKARAPKGAWADQVRPKT